MAFTEGSKVFAAVDCEIFASPTSEEVIGKLTKHQSVVAAGSVVDVDEYQMLPIKPRGAVQVDYLEGRESMEDGGMEAWELDVEQPPEPVTQGSRGEGLLDQAEPAGLPRTEEGSTGPEPAMQQSGMMDTPQPALTVGPRALGREALEKAISAEKKVLEQRQRMHRVALAHGRASNDFAFRAAERTVTELEKKLTFLQDRLERDTSYLDDVVETNYGKRTRRENYKGMLDWAQRLLSERAAFSSEGPPEDKESALLWQRLLTAMDDKIASKRAHEIHADATRRLMASEALVTELGLVNSALAQARETLSLEESLRAGSDADQTRRLLLGSESKLLALQSQYDSPSQGDSLSQAQKERIAHQRQLALEKREAKRARVSTTV